jgi:hypothetical protein
VAGWTIKEPRGVWASQVFTLSLTLAGCLWAFFSDPRQELQHPRYLLIGESIQNTVSQPPATTSPERL